jgi:ribose-phosphate pyrophosphokinase
MSPVVAATHGLLLPGARRKLEEAAVQEVYVTDTVPPVEQDWSRLRVVSVAPLIAAAIERSLAGSSTGDDSR